MEYAHVRNILLTFLMAALMASGTPVSLVALTSRPRTEHGQELLQPSDLQTMSLPGEKETFDKEIQCILHHEFAVFVHPDEIHNFYSPDDGVTGVEQMPSLRTYVNARGKVK